MVQREAPPGRRSPLPVRADGGGVTGHGRFGKPLETMGRQSYGATAGETPLCSPGCDLSKP